MGMTAILAKIWNSMARRRRQRLALAELMRMSPRRRDELGIDLVVLREAMAERDRVSRESTIHPHPRKGRDMRSSLRPLWERDRFSAFSGKAG